MGQGATGRGSLLRSFSGYTEVFTPLHANNSDRMEVIAVGGHGWESSRPMNMAGFVWLHALRSCFRTRLALQAENLVAFRAPQFWYRADYQFTDDPLQAKDRADWDEVPETYCPNWDVRFEAGSAMNLCLMRQALLLAILSLALKPPRLTWVLVPK